MRHTKKSCVYCPPPPGKPHPHHDWETHPSWIAGVEALNDYGHWVSTVVLPVAFQWIEEHKAEVYATVPEELKDDVGVVLAAAFKLIKELPAYQAGQEHGAAFDAASPAEAVDSAKINPVWSGITRKVRASTEAAFAEQSALLGDPLK